jgi:hypothetical protein
MRGYNHLAGFSSVTPLDEVNITNINHSGGSNIFNHDKLPGNGRHRKVSALFETTPRETEKIYHTV